MYIKILIILTSLATLNSCSTAYRTGQTPDDVYYSPAKESSRYVAANNRDEDDYQQYDDYDTYHNDRWMRMSIGNPYRMSVFNDYYWNDWGYGLGYSPWARPFYWNSFYNPYAYNYYIFINPKTPAYFTAPARPTVFNAGAYNTGTNKSSAARSYYNPRTGVYSNYSNTNSSGGQNSNLRRTTPGRYYNTNNNTRNANSGSYTPSNNSTDRPVRTYTPSYSPSPSTGGNNEGGNSGGIRRPTRN
jgi:hypothetical protein